jgi:hypothetical protein
VRPIDVSEILDIAAYERERKNLRPRIMALKDRRRIRLGEHMSMLFENRDTVRYQIQEMMRIERIVEPDAIRHEVDTYNELIPGRNELSASLFIEYETPQEREVWLRALLGLEHHVGMEVAGRIVKARFDTRQIASDRLSSVQYIKFPLDDEQVRRWKEGARIFVDHPRYQAEHVLTREQLEELARDFEE